MGAGKSVECPAYLRILASYPERRRGFANSVIDAGTRTGPALGTLLGGLLMARFESADQIRRSSKSVHDGNPDNVGGEETARAARLQPAEPNVH